MDRWKFVNEKWIPRPVSRGEGYVSGDTAFPIQPPPLRGTSFHRKEGVSTRAHSFGRDCRAQRGGVGFLFCDEAASSLPSPCRESFVRRYCFSTYACIRFDGARKAVFSYHSLPHWGRGTASAVDRVLSQTAYLRRSPSLSFIPLEPYPARSARHLPLKGKALCRG